MTIFSQLADLKAAVANITAPDLSTLATAAEFAALSAQVTNLLAEVGTESTPTAS